jgi:DNA-binding CsgD family transcriptional regulator
MGVHARTWFTPKQRAELWERWRSGQCVADIARALERRNKSGVYRVLALNGGIAPRPRRRAQRALRLAEREEISRGIAAGWSMRRIAQALGRSPSTVSREIRRNDGLSAYRVQLGRSACLGTGFAPEALSPGAPCGATMAHRAEARAAVVAEADRRLAEVAIPCQQRHAGIARDDLSKSLHSDTRCAEKGADDAPAHRAADAPGQGRHDQERTGTDRRCGFYPRTAGRGRGSCRAWPLGRRPSLGSKQTGAQTACLLSCAAH